VTTSLPAEELEHGDPRRYRRGCHCAKCRAGANRRNIKNRYLRQTGRPTMRTADKAADHLLRLRAAGLDDKTIRKLTGICPDVLYRILRREGTIHARTETRILRVPVPAANGRSTNRAYIPGHGTIRRLRALIAAGWYMAELARRLGKQKENLKQILDRGENSQVTHYLAEEVRALYSELHDQKPEQHGVTPRFAERARKHAAARGWATPAYWDPEDKPATETTDLAAQIVAENAAWLLASGLHRDLASKQLGKSRFYVDRALREHPETLKEAA
jgi:AraC-like DNA-binding protein